MEKVSFPVLLIIRFTWSNSLAIIQLSWGKLRREPATRWFDESFAPINKFEDRFARQNPFELPSGFPLTLPYSFIDHHLSGLSIYTFTRIFQHLVFFLVLFDISPFLREKKKKDCNNYLLSLHIFTLWFGWWNICIFAKLLGPCFKTGESGAFHQYPQEQQVIFLLFYEHAVHCNTQFSALFRSRKRQKQLNNIASHYNEHSLPSFSLPYFTSSVPCSLDTKIILILVQNVNKTTHCWVIRKHLIDWLYDCTRILPF